jgi:two-component sensor histidine kinase
VKAELLRVQGKDVEAAETYDSSIGRAKQSGYCQEEALACEIAARFYNKKRRRTLETAYAHDARECYYKWGAATKVADMDALYTPAGLGTSDAALAHERVGSETIVCAINSLAEGLDLLAIMRAAQAISSEIHLKGLTQTLMRLAVEIAGAERGVLVLHEEEGLRVAAIWPMSASDIHRDGYSLHGEALDFPVGIVNFVLRTRDVLVLDDAMQDPTFGHERYVLAGKARSIACLPVVQQKSVKGGLYLENNLAPRSFTRAHIEALKILCSQAAIALENAALYEEVREHSVVLEHEVAERTSELAAANEQLTDALKEKEVLLREIHHRVKNNLAIISSFLRMQSRTVDDHKVRDMFDAAQARVNSLNVLHQKLYMSQNLARVPASDYLCSLAEHLHDFYGSMGNRIQLEEQIGEIFLDASTAMPLGFIVTELVSNCMKHAFPHDNGGHILINLNRLDEGLLKLIVSDNGVGLPEEVLLGENRSLGLRLVEIFVKQLDGELQLFNEGGTKIAIKFSLPKER